MRPNETKLTGQAATDDRQGEGPYRRVRLNAWLGGTKAQPLSAAHIIEVARAIATSSPIDPTPPVEDPAASSWAETRRWHRTEETTAPRSAVSRKGPTC